MVEIVTFLGTFISQDVTWTVHITSLVKMAQQWLCFQLPLTQNWMSPPGY